MNPIISEKISQLTAAHDYECWYLVKHSTDFCNLCYLVDALKYQQDTKKYANVEKAVEAKITEVNKNKGLSLSTNYRALRVAAFFGLIEMINSKYDDAIITSVFYEIKKLCLGNFEDISKYQNIIDRQIEKLYVSSTIDEGKNGVRNGFSIFPVMFLYKILLELGKATGIYSISYTEYSYLVATTRKYEDFLDTMFLIKLCRDDSSIEPILKTFDKKYDNRMNKAIELLSCLDCSSGKISIKPGYIKYVSDKVFAYENGNYKFDDSQYIKFLCSNKEIAISKDDDSKEEFIVIDEKTRLHCGTNIILYGVPGAGKSYTIKKEYCDEDTKMERVVFHPDYTYSDFVGQILPKSVNGDVTYSFMPGPFTKIVRDAYLNPTIKYILVIEEINRGNAPAIFGDIFQLMDRDLNEKIKDPTGLLIDNPAYCSSDYGITNADVAKIVYGDEEHEVKIPSNMSIICTMNTSDQNVFTLDTAFQRRWNMRLIENTFKKDTPEEKAFAEHPILDTDVSWEEFCEAINKQILEKNQNMTSSEDKRLGTHFVNMDDLVFDTRELDNSIDEGLKKEARLRNRRFPEKVIKYLWDDAFKFYRDEIFKTEYDSLEKVIRDFSSKRKNDRFNIFKDNIKAAIEEISKKSLGQ